MSGLDPVGRREVRDIILELKKCGQDDPFSDAHLVGRGNAVRPRRSDRGWTVAGSRGSRIDRGSENRWEWKSYSS